MIKRLITALTAILGVSIISYMYFNSSMLTTLNAQSAPTFQIPKGAKVVLGKYTGREIVWDIGNNANDYVLMSSKPIVDSIAIYDPSLPEITSPVAIEDRNKYCLRYFNKKNSMITYCPPTALHEEIGKIDLNTKETNILLRNPFLPDIAEVFTGGSLGLTGAERAYKVNGLYYWLDGQVTTNADGGIYASHYGIPIQLSTDRGNALQYQFFDTGIEIPQTDLLDWAYPQWWSHLGGGTQPRALRPYSVLRKSKIVFAANTSYTDGAWHAYSIDTSNLNENNELNANKLRIQSSLTAVLQDIKNVSKTKSIQKAIKNGHVNLSVNANTGTNTRISVLLYNETGSNIQYYKMLEATKSGTNDYSLDLTGMAVGKYKLAVINEEYEASSQLPVESSAISELLPLEIVEPHKLSYTKAPQSGALSGKDYEFSKNVNAGQIIGKITVNPLGITPLTYTVESDGDDTYQNFEIDGLDSNGASSSSSLNVKIKSSAPDLVNGGLKAGSYKFCVSAKDANGDPTTATADSKVCTTFTVDQTDLTVAFDDVNQTKKSITEATATWNETATTNPSACTKITYSVSGGDTYLIDIDANTGKISYTGGGAFGKVKIKATADDDPSSGNDNYDSAFTEKEIVIYQEVDGHVNPDGNSSDNTVPTFTASDSNIKINGIIGTIVGTLGTSASLDNSQPTYRYGIKAGEGDANFFSVDANSGVIKTTANLGVKSYHITVTVSDSWSTKEIPVTINVGVAAAENLQFYETTAAINMITKKSVKITDTGVSVYATVKGSTNNNPVTYKIKDGSNNIITINPNNGAVTMHGVGTVTIVAEKKGAAGQGDAQAELTFIVTAGVQEFIYTDDAGNELPKSGSIYNAYVQSYAPSKSFQLYTAGNPIGSTVNYQLKAGSPTDVISVDPSGLVTILNASLNNQMGKVIVQATSHDPRGNYADKTIELPINIDKGTRIITFAENPIYVVNGKGKVEPVIEVDGVVDTSGDILIEVDSNEDHTIAWTNDNKVIDYNYSGETGKDIKIHATKPMDRNYKVAEADGTIHIMGPDENVLAITSPGQIIYGDHFTIKSTQYDADSTNVQYTFEIDDTTYISNPTVNGNKAEFDALKYSGSKKTTITVTRTADGESPLSKKVQVTVLPKPIEITIDDQEKYKGEPNPELTCQDFRSQLVTWNGTQDVIQEKDIKLSTTAKTNSNAGSYPIKGDGNTLNKTYPNYNFTFKEGILTVKEDNIEDDWYHLELDDGNNTTYTGQWTNRDVNIISDHNEYKNMSLNQSTWKPNQVTVNKEGENNQSFWMKKDSEAITKEKKEIIKIDKTPPKVKGIKAKDTNNKLQDIINKLSGGIFFKPGTTFEITTSDAKGDLKVSGTKEISYKVYKLDTVARAGEELIKEGNLTISNEKGSIKLDETTGAYKICVILTDHAGNISGETCKQLNIRAIGVDSDGDGIPDINIDTDGDGIPDLNVTRNPDDPEDRLPYLNIDTDGDGKPDMNIDTNGDGIPDINTGIIKEWHPDQLVDLDGDGNPDYKTDSTLKGINNIDTDNDGYPDLNLDLDLDGLPELNINTDGKLDKPQTNIDSDGDGKPDINIDEDKDGIPDKNIVEITEWKPNHNISKDGKIIYDTMKIELNEEPDNDGKQPDSNDPTDQSDPSVKGMYNPITSMGGANTGDSTNILLYITIVNLSLGIISYLLYKKFYVKNTL